MPVYLLEKEKIYFPRPELAQENGLLAVGGDLSIERLLLAYSNGIFPWYNKGEEIKWWCPKERFIIRPSDIHISRSMKKYFRSHQVSFILNRDFADTIHRCRVLREFNEGTWITDEMEEAYLKLHKAGFSASLEAVSDGRIAGGLYGVVIGRCFFGESMYSNETNGSKAALIGLADLLDRKGFVMIDCQIETEHLKKMGGIRISYESYMELIKSTTT